MKGLPEVTLPGFRSRRQRETANAGGFPDTGETIPQIRDRVRPPSYDSTAITFTGASGAGLHPDAIYGPPQPAPPAPPQRRPDCAIWVFIPGGVGLLCGIDLWRRHDDPEIAHVRYGVFDALRDSALRAGWRLDAGGVWNCPRCKMNPAYRTPQPLAHWHPDAYSGRGRHITGHDGYQDAQFWLQVQAENVVLERTRDGVRNGRHRAGPR